MYNFLITFMLFSLVIVSAIFVVVVSKRIAEKQEGELTEEPDNSVDVQEITTDSPEVISATLTIDPSNTSITVTETVLVEEPVKVSKPAQRKPRTNNATKPASKRVRAKK